MDNKAWPSDFQCPLSIVSSSTLLSRTLGMTLYELEWDTRRIDVQRGILSKTWLPWFPFLVMTSPPGESTWSSCWNTLPHFKLYLFSQTWASAFIFSVSADPPSTCQSYLYFVTHQFRLYLLRCLIFRPGWSFHKIIVVILPSGMDFGLVPKLS